MSYVLTLVASEQASPVSGWVIDQIKVALKERAVSLTMHDPVWLEQDKAVDLAIAEKPGRDTLSVMREILKGPKIDLFINHVDQRQKKLVLADMDSTIVAAETLDELAVYAGLKDKIAEITELAMNGKLDFETALRERVSLLKGLKASSLQETLEKMEINPGAQEFVQTMRKKGAVCVLVSGGFSFFTEAIAKNLGFHFHHGNRLDIDLQNGTLTGKVLDPVLDKNTKIAELKRYAQKLKLSLSQCIAIGDGANDLPMLKAAGLGVGYRPKEMLAKELDNLLLYGDFTALLYAQGIT